MRRIGNILRGSSSPWSAFVDGQDVVVRGIVATCFGGGFDRGDNGETESGIMNDGRDPNLLGCALPIRSVEVATAGSPLAFPGLHIPWESKVKVWRVSEGEESALTLILIDNGPNQLVCPTHGIDFTPAVAQHFAPHIPLEQLANEFEEGGFSFQIIGAARFAPTS